MEEEIKLLNDAFEIYNLDDREDISTKVLDYIADRILANRYYINQLIELLKEDYTFTDIWDAFENARNVEEHYKKSQTFRKIDSLFFMGVYATSKGNIVVETDSVTDIVKYFVDAIKTRNTITISKLDYNEVSIESVLLVILCEALNKFGLDRNLIMIMPYEECFYENFDEVIINENGKQKIDNKQVSNKYIIYIENNSFKDEIEIEKKKLEEKGLEYEVIEGEFYEAIRKINSIKPIGACIYTSDLNLGYKFINLVHSNNVFVNTTLLNSEDYSKDNNVYYLKKKIIYPMIGYDNNGDFAEEGTVDESVVEEKVVKEEMTIETPKEVTVEEPKKQDDGTEFKLVVPNANPWYKRIFEAIKNFFTK